MIYFVYLLILIVLLFLEHYNKRFSSLYRIIIPVLFSLLIGLRGESIGFDTQNYTDIFNSIARWGGGYLEVGYEWLQHTIYTLGGRTTTLFLVVAFITNFFFYLALRNQKGIYYTIPALCLYLIPFSFLVNGIRQGIAIAILLYAYKFISQRKVVPYIALLLLATLFHTSAILMLPLYFIPLLRLSNKLIIIIYLISFIGAFIDLAPYLPDLSLGSGRGDYSHFIDNLETENRSYLGFAVSSLLNIITFFLMLKNKVFQNKETKVLAYIILIDFILKNIGFHHFIIIRFAKYFVWFVFFMYPFLLSKKKKYLFHNRQLTILVIFVFNFVLWLNIIFSAENKIYPYEFYWEDSITIIN